MADDELSESALNEKSEEDLNDQLLQELHSKIDAIFAGGETGLDVSQQIFALRLSAPEVVYSFSRSVYCWRTANSWSVSC